MYGRKSYAIVAYQTTDAILCPDCTVKAVVADPEMPTSPAAVDMDAESLLEQVAADLGIDREHEDTFDSSEFPKVVFSDMLSEGETCTACGEEL